MPEINLRYYFCCSSSIKSVIDPTIIDISNAELLDRLIEKTVTDISNNSILTDSIILEADIQSFLSEKKAEVEDIAKETIETIVDNTIETVVETTLETIVERIPEDQYHKETYAE